MNCPKCNSLSYVKSGIINKKQRYRCKDCNRHFTVEIKSTAKPESMKKAALHLYIEGLGFRSIGRYLGVSNVAVLKWIKSFGEEIKALHSNSKEIEVVELDEMHTYIGQKKTTSGYGLLLIDMGNGSSISQLETGVVKVVKPYGKK